MVNFLEGYIPDNVPEGFWVHEAGNIAHEPRTYTVQVFNQENDNTEIVHFTTDWSQLDVAVGQFTGVDRFWLLKYIIPRIEKSTPPQSNQKNILLGISEFPKTFNMDRDLVDNTKITGIFMLDWCLNSNGEKLLFSRSDVFCKPSEHLLEQMLNQSLPTDTID